MDPFRVTFEWDVTFTDDFRLSEENIDQLRLVTQEFLQRELRNIAGNRNIPQPTISIGEAVLVDTATLLRTIEFSDVSVSFAGTQNIPDATQIRDQIFQILQDSRLDPTYFEAVQMRVSPINPFSQIVAINSVAAEIEGARESYGSVANETDAAEAQVDASTSTSTPAPSDSVKTSVPPTVPLTNAQSQNVQLALGSESCSLKAHIECHDKDGNPCTNTSMLTNCTAEGIMAEIVFRYFITNEGSSQVTITAADSHVNGGQAVDFSTHLERNPIPADSSSRVLTFGEIAINACFPIQITSVFEVEGTTMDGTVCSDEAVSSFGITAPSP